MDKNVVPSRPSSPDPDAQHKKVFFDNAFFLLAHRETILADPCMAAALVRIPLVRPFLASKPNEYMTLGAYLDMWHSSSHSRLIDDTGQMTLIYRAVGNPGTNGHLCYVIYENGRTATTHSPYTLRSILSCFGRVKKKYQETRNGEAPYTLEKVVEMLRAEEQEHYKTT